VDRAAAQQLSLFLAGWLIRMIIRLAGGGNPATAASLVGLPMVGRDEHHTSRLEPAVPTQFRCSWEGPSLAHS